MKRMLLFAAALLTLAPLSAQAADVIWGTVTRTDPATGMVLLSDGNAYQVLAPSLLYGMAPGTKVFITRNADGTVGIAKDPNYQHGGSW